MAVLGARTRELPVLMGRHKSLVGIFTESSQSRAVTAPPTVVLLNAGIVHRVGPTGCMFCWLVHLLQPASLRCDLICRGLATAPAAPEATTPLEFGDVRHPRCDGVAGNKQADTQGGPLRSLLGRGPCDSLCQFRSPSGRHYSARSQYSEDPQILPLPIRGKAIEFRQEIARGGVVDLGQVLQPKSFCELAVPKSFGRAGGLAPSLPTVSCTLFSWAITEQCVEAGVQIMVVTTGGEQGRYGEQILDAFPDIAFGDRLTLEHLPRSDHTFTREADRDWLAVNLQKWMMKCGFASVTYSAV